MVQKRDNIALNIVLQLLKSNLHIRGIAQKLRESHSTILRKLNTLKQANVVDARVEGKNKIFFLKQNLTAKTYIQQAELHKRITLLKKNPELGILIEEILQSTGEKLVVLFGSHAKGLAKKQSDIDVYVETKSRATKKVIEEIHSKINVKIGSFDTTSPLIKEIIKDHVILKGVEVFYEQLSSKTKKRKEA